MSTNDINSLTTRYDNSTVYLRQSITSRLRAYTLPEIISYNGEMYNSFIDELVRQTKLVFKFDYLYTTVDDLVYVYANGIQVMNYDNPLFTLYLEEIIKLIEEKPPTLCVLEDCMDAWVFGLCHVAKATGFKNYTA